MLSVPWQLLELLASKAEVFSSVLRIFERVVLGWYRTRGTELGCGNPETGAVSVQRFGGSMNACMDVQQVADEALFRVLRRDL